MHPWHTQAWQQVLRYRDQNRLPHSWLLTGAANTGLETFADRLAKSLLCHAFVVGETDEACTTCKGCLLHQDHQHPDWLQLKNDEGKALGVDAIREGVKHLGTHRHQTNTEAHRVVYLPAADTMTNQAANSLLKNLEEPPAYTSFILVARRTETLPATILSRCQRLALPMPSPEQSLSWLQEMNPDATAQQCDMALRLSDQLPMASLALLEAKHGAKDLAQRQDWLNDIQAVFKQNNDPVGIAGKVKPVDLAAWVSTWQSELAYQIRQLSGISPQTANQSASENRALDHAAKDRSAVYLEMAFDQWRELTHAQSWLARPINQRLLVERLLIDWQQMGKRLQQL